MPKGATQDQHEEFTRLTRALLSNGVSMDSVARAVGYATVPSLERVLDGKNPPTEVRLRRLKAYVEAAPTPPEIPENVEQAILYLMGVWFFLDGALPDVPPIMRPGYREARDRTEALIDFFGGKAPNLGGPNDG